jgi:hypothetical protein
VTPLQSSEECLPRAAYSAVDAKLFGIVFVASPDQQIHVNGLELSPARSLYSARDRRDTIAPRPPVLAPSDAAWNLERELV